MTQSSCRWVVVAAGGLMGCVAMGSLFALPVLLTPMAEATGWSRTDIAAVMTVAFLAMSVTSMAAAKADLLVAGEAHAGAVAAEAAAGPRLWAGLSTRQGPAKTAWGAGFLAVRGGAT